jgi:uncharacterized protein (TIGR02145 family)
VRKGQLKITLKTGENTMRTKLTKIIFAATLVLALAFTLSCSSSDDDSGGSDKGNDIANYRTVVIGGQTWMAENLNYNVEGSKCYGDYDTDDLITLSSAEIQSNCAKYGRLYDWSTAMALPSSCNSATCSSQVSAKHRGICPSGWHIPTNADWDELYRYADGTNGTESPYLSPTAGEFLKATSGWYSNGNGTDAHGFSALPGGYGISDGDFTTVGYGGYWWSASEDSSYRAYRRDMYYIYEDAGWNNYLKDGLFSVRCLQD